ncbi:DNA polymerase III subunit delta [Geobacillus stearothermophilus]|uniref:DNA polymerase III subunit delta n=1 Tax=Geobacillus stearothermophilus TaxID=1422 RepID=UPI002402B066|nr:DNA polymerase III subunit delta [Geobacillus stearothermophilus]MDF9295460.1 DNA polymerase III subunit delta [Geobacillus stearothermophilus]
MLERVWGNMEKRRFSPLYLLYGSEPFLLTETYDRLVKAALSEEEREWNLAVYDCEETPVQAALEEAETVPFFGERRVILVKNPYFFTAEKDKEIEHDLAKLETYFRAPAPFSIVVFLAPYDKLDERKRITKLAKEQCEVVAAAPLQEAELRAWVRRRLESQGASVTEEAIELLLQRAGTRLSALANEIDKLALFAGPGGVVDEAAVEQLVARTPEENVFALVEQVARRDIPGALQTFYDLLEHNEEPIKILALLASHFRLLAQVKWLAQTGYGQTQIASALNVHPFRVKLALAQAARFSDAELTEAITELAAADYDVKSGAMDRRLAVELLLMRWGARPGRKSQR